MLAAVGFSGFNGIRVAEHATLGDAFFVALVAAWMMSWPLGKHIRVMLPVAVSFFMFCLALMVCFVAGTSDAGLTEDSRTLAKVVIAFFVLPYLVSDIANKRQHVRAVIFIYVVGAAANVAVSILDTLGITRLEEWLGVKTVGGWEYETRFHGLTMHPNHLGQLGAIASVLALGILPNRESKSARNLWIATELLLIVGVIGSGSRGALLAVLIVGFALVVHKGSLLARTSRLAFFAGLGLLAGALISHISESTPVVGAISRLFGNAPGVQDSTEARWVAYTRALKDFSEKPIAGAGFSYVGGNVENIYLQFLQGAGLIGLVGLLCYFSPLWRAWKRVRTRPDDLLLLAVTGSIVVYLLITLTQNLVYARFSLVPMGLLWTLLADRRAVETTRRLRRVPNPVQAMRPISNS